MSDPRAELVPVPAEDLARLVLSALEVAEVTDPEVARTVRRLNAHAPAVAARLLAGVVEVCGAEACARLVDAVLVEEFVEVVAANPPVGGAGPHGQEVTG